MVRIKGKFLTLCLLLFPSVALPAGSGMPWEGPLDQILNSISGPWLRFGSVVAVIGLGLGLALSESHGILKKAMMVTLGLSVACAASSWALSFFGFTGGIGF